VCLRRHVKSATISRPAIPNSRWRPAPRPRRRPVLAIGSLQVFPAAAFRFAAQLHAVAIINREPGLDGLAWIVINRNGPATN
jgi:hypothetical protein